MSLVTFIFFIETERSLTAALKSHLIVYTIMIVHNNSKYKSFPYKKTNLNYVFLSDKNLFNNTLTELDLFKNLDFYTHAYSPSLYENRPHCMNFLIYAEVESRDFLDSINAKYIDISREVLFLTGLIFENKSLDELNEKECTQLCKIIINCFTKIDRYYDDNYSIDVDKIFRIPIKRYISESIIFEPIGKEPIDILFHLSIEKPKLIIDAIAGCGKSTALVHLYNKHFTEYFYRIGIRKMIIAVPTTAIAQQLYYDFDSKHEEQFPDIMQSGIVDPKTKEQQLTGKFKEVTILTNGMRADQISFALNHSFVTITCFDSISKFPTSILRESLCIVDEYHQLVNDINYRDKKRFTRAFDKISLCKRKILMSATPNYHFTKNYDSRLNYEVVKFEPQEKNRIIIQPYTYSSAMKELPFYVMEIDKENQKDQKGLIFAKFDSIVDLASTHEYFNNRGIKTEYFHSKDRKQKEENENYKSLMKTGSIDDDIELCLSTTLLEAGVSIKNNVKLLALIDCDKYQKAIQLINRPRMNTETISIYNNNEIESEEKIEKNKEINVVMFRNIRKDKDLKTPKNLTAKTCFYIANNLKKVWQKYGERGDENYRLQHDMPFDKCVYFDDNGNAQVNVLEILHEIYVNENKSDFHTMLNRIKRTDDRVTIRNVQNLEQRESLDEFKHLRNEIVETNKTNKEYLYALLENKETREMTLKSMCFLSKDAKLKMDAQHTFNIPLIDRDNCREFINEHERAFINTKHNKLLKDIKFLVADALKDIESAIKICKESNQSKIASAKNTLKSIKRQKILSKDANSLSMFDRVNAEMDRIFRNRIEDKSNRIKKGDNKYIFTGEKIMKIANKVRKKESANSNFKPLTERGALALLRTLFIVKSKNVKIGKKTIRHYKVVSRKTKKNVDNTLK